MKFSKKGGSLNNGIEVTTVLGPLTSISKKKNKKIIPWIDSVFILISMIMLLVVIVPSLLNTKSTDKEDAFTIAQTLADLTNKGHPNNFIYTKDMLLSAAARINPGPDSTVELKLSINDGILVSHKNYYACVKLSSTGAVAYPVTAKSLC